MIGKRYRMIEILYRKKKINAVRSGYYVVWLGYDFVRKRFDALRSDNDLVWLGYDVVRSGYWRLT